MSCFPPSSIPWRQPIRLTDHPKDEWRRRGPTSRLCSRGRTPRAGILSGRGFDGDRIDVAIAATAELHGFAILTNNAHHFEPMGVRFLNPFDALPP
jgi:hypothetical protein